MISLPPTQKKRSTPPRPPKHKKRGVDRKTPMLAEIHLLDASPVCPTARLSTSSFPFWFAQNHRSGLERMRALSFLAFVRSWWTSCLGPKQKASESLLPPRGYQCAFALALGFSRCVGYDLLCLSAAVLAHGTRLLFVRCLPTFLAFFFLRFFKCFVRVQFLFSWFKGKPQKDSTHFASSFDTPTWLFRQSGPLSQAHP